jgi:CheY-like chemotaxis protein
MLQNESSFSQTAVSSMQNKSGESNVRQMKILVIDDNEQTTTMLSKFLNAKGHTVTVTNDPMEGMNYIRKEQFDVILLDITMPVVSGIGVIELLAGDGTLQNQNIFIFSGISLPEIQLKNLLRRDGVSGFLKKPMELEKLLKAITI